MSNLPSTSTTEQWTPPDYTASVYAKLPLPYPRSIRLLNIYPSAPSAPVCCTLEVFNLDDEPVYEALSYVWGAIHPRKYIECNRVSMEVNPNLYAALLRLRYPQVNESRESIAGGYRRIWIDALCINQADLDERSSQVAFMKKIYDAADDVFVWLGPDPGYGSDAISLVKRIANVAKNEPDYDPGNPLGFDVSDYPLREDLPSPDDEIWDKFNAFLQNEWFRRVWVLQEVARDDGQMVLGSHEMSLRDFYTCSAWLLSKDYIGRISRIGGTAAIRPINFLMLGTGRRSLPDMLKYTAEMKSTDPRDQIYAMLGLYSMFLYKKGLQDHSIKVDYTLPVSAVYQGIVRYFINLPKGHHAHAGSLRIMLRNEIGYDEDWQKTWPPDPADDTEFPSWVPRWDSVMNFWSAFEDRQNTSFKPWDTNGIPPQVRTLTDSNILSLKGLKVCTIAYGMLMKDVEDFQQNIHALETSPSILKRYGEENVLRDTLAKIMTAGKAKNAEKAEPFGREDLEEWLTNPEGPIGQKFGEECSSYNLFFVTTSGYMGLGSIGLKSEDIVCILYGGKMLYILRPVKDKLNTYYLIGECYVHGLMHGEAMEMLETGDAKEEWFDLC